MASSSANSGYSLEKLRGYADGNDQMLTDFLKSWLQAVRRHFHCLVNGGDRDPVVRKALVERLSYLLEMVEATSLLYQLSKVDGGKLATSRLRASLNRLISQIEAANQGNAPA